VAQQLKNLLIDIEQSLSPIKNTKQPNNLKFESEVNQNNKLVANSKIINNNSKEEHCPQLTQNKININSDINSEFKTVDNTIKLTSKNKMARPQQLVPNIFNGSGDECVLEFF